jgi:WD40 repeat protein
VRFWDVTRGAAVGAAREQPQPVRAVAFAGDGSWIVAAGGGPVAVTEVNGPRRAALDIPDRGAAHALAIAPDAAAVYLGTDAGAVRRIDLQGGPTQVATAAPEAKPPTPSPAVALPPAVLRPKWASDGREGRLHSLAFGRGGRILVSGGADRTIRVWDAATGKEIHTYSNLTNPEANVAASRDGAFVLGAGNGIERVGRIVLPADTVLRSMTLASNKDFRIGAHFYPISCLALASHGRYALTGSHDKSVRHWDVRGARQLMIFQGHAGTVRGVDYSPQVVRAVSVADDDTARFWDLLGQREALRIDGLPGSPKSVAYAPDGKSVLIAGPGVLGTWDATTGKLVHNLGTGGAACWAPTGTAVAVAGRDGVAVREVATGKDVRRFEGCDDPVAVAVAPDGKFVAAAGDKLAVWELAEPLAQPTPEPGPGS